MLAFLAFVERGRLRRAFLTGGRASAGVAVFMAISSGTFMLALSYASVANVLFMQAVAPMLAALLARLFLGERVTRRVQLAMALALAGVGVMVGGPGAPGWIGVALSVLMTFAFAAVLVIARHSHAVSMAPASCVSQALVVAVAAPFATIHDAGAQDLLLLVALGVGQIGLGLVLFTAGARLIPAAQTALLSLLEIVLAPVWVWAVFQERPSAATIVGGAIVLLALLVQLERPRGGQGARP